MLARLQEKKCVKRFVEISTRAWQPVPTWRCSIIFFSFLGLILLLIGIGILFYSRGVVEVVQRYDDICLNINSTCKVIINVPSDMKPPVYFYYGLNYFYQNHKRLINSRSGDQLKGKILTMDQGRTDCAPTVTNREMGQTKAVDGTTLNPDAVAYPCGTLARAFFTDTFELYKGTKNITIDQTNIAWEFDKTNYFKNQQGNWKSIQWIDITDEHFINWMRVSTLPNFRKLWGRINQPLEAGKYTLSITNNYDVSGISSEKLVFITTGGFLGSKNWVLAIVYMSIGGLSIVVAMIFYMNKKFHKRR